ncbi:glutamine amidotransferase [Nocardioides bizhenqiangii]|uniref:Glutamine amidotransferase n=1 Tax=Nocardioides bizhenqiangii TaxID=3095076 RepID=A0ABZ0ZLK0_9ACTN|nr:MULTISPECIES: glutamine amidotransferase [unclassified Nocardioides]MDZ5620212.1 glutamine amidotransferase [Nocardioides sp. HM23]WQQ24589.1 glutamine amidotransferase [Nocardioides sp. HM61]
MASDPAAKPFLLLSIRTEERAALEEHAAFSRFLGIAADELHRIELGTAPLPSIDLDDWAGIILGGGAFNASDPEESKSPAQLLAERDLGRLLDDVTARDYPFLGACYGIGSIGLHQGAVVDRSFPEGVGPVSVELTDEGLADPLFAGMPREFRAYGGHKEAISRLPEHAVALATSEAAPVQAFRVGKQVYATQFHPELDLDGILTRIAVYAHHGYFDPSEQEALSAAAAAVTVTHPMTILRNFAARCRHADAIQS